MLARSSQGYQERLQSKIDMLDATMKSRRQVEKAIRLLVDHQGMTEAKSYEHMRSRATSMRVTVGEVAGMLIEAQEAMDKLGLGRPRGA